MLSLKNVTKIYKTDAVCVEALRGISIDFRKSEFVSILGPSGCGKTTLLNIIGGLDRYTEGDLLIAGRSTSLFSSHDWDSYRNHSIGFVFQSYNLISHQSVLSNVELALTLSGVSKNERRKRAKEVLCKVGLEEQISKKPNQLSGGQMQRVAIARALVNDPEILLADEPTGALDSETSLQIMELLKEISRDRLVIMVTHNPDLAERYSTRIVRLLDGRITDDTDPYTEDTAEQDAENKEKPKKDNGKYTKTSMSFFTALSLSLNNLMTKKGRTALISFAGSIGIIGIALILSLSNGINSFISDVQKDTLSSYPIQIRSEEVDMSALVETLSGQDGANVDRSGRAEDRVYQNTIIYELMNSMISSSSKKNDLASFKKYLETADTGIEQYVSAISYGYDVQPLVYSEFESGDIKKINPSTVLETMYGETSASYYQNMMKNSGNYEIWGEILSDQDGNGINKLLLDQYDVVYGRWPQAYNEVVVFISEHNELNDMVLYSLGLKDPDELPGLMKKIMNGEELPITDESWSYEEICSLEYSLLLPTDVYAKDPESGVWEDMSANDAYLTIKVRSAPRIKVVGIVRPNDTALATVQNGSIGYTKELTEYLMKGIADTEIVKQQTSDKVITADNVPYRNTAVIGYKFNEIDVFSGNPFKENVKEEELSIKEKASKFIEYISSLDEETKAKLFVTISSTPTEEQIQTMLSRYMEQFNDRSTIEAAIEQYYSAQSGMDESEIKAYLDTLTDDELTSMITEFMTRQIKESYEEETAQAFEKFNADQLIKMLDDMISESSEEDLAKMNDEFAPSEYSESTLEENVELLGLCTEDEPSSVNIYAVSFESKESISAIIEEYNQTKTTEAEKITYTDYIAIMMSSVSVIIDAISYVLIAFVSISLVVSSIMIGIITYISVLERTKEIGILRAIGASKRDISHVFNAETFLLGLAAGIIGIVITILLNLPITAIIRAASGISGISAALPVLGGIVLVLISIALTFIAGLIPAKIAARKDPVVALRTE